MLLSELHPDRRFPMDSEWRRGQLRLYWKVQDIMDDLWPEGVHCEYVGCNVVGRPSESTWKPTRAGDREFFLYACLRFPDQRRRSPSGRDNVISAIDVIRGAHGNLVSVDGRPLKPICQNHHHEVEEKAFEIDVRRYLRGLPPGEARAVRAEIDAEDGDFDDDRIPVFARVEPWVNVAAFYLYVKLRRDPEFSRFMWRLRNEGAPVARVDGPPRMIPGLLADDPSRRGEAKLPLRRYAAH